MQIPDSAARGVAYHMNQTGHAQKASEEVVAVPASSSMNEVGVELPVERERGFLRVRLPY